jgi:putative heme-binding domain-containing protein
LAEKVKRHWGSIRADRDPKREEVIAEMRSFLRKTAGNAVAGQEVFKRVCGQCHKLHGEGQEVGPDITANGRASFEQLLSNVFDPSLVIGASYQARTVVTADGRVLTGLVVEDSDQRLVLKAQGGKLETIPRRDVEIVQVSRLSLMPEDLEKQLKPQELADLFALLTLDKPPSDPTARRLPGSRPIVPRETTDPKQFASLVEEVAPGFSAAKVGKPGLAIVAEHAGRPGVLRTHCPSAHEPLVMRGAVELPKGKRSRLVLAVSSASPDSWLLKINADGRALHQQTIGASSADWQTISVDLGSMAGHKVKLELLQIAVDGKPAAAYWAQAEVISE